MEITLKLTDIKESPLSDDTKTNVAIGALDEAVTLIEESKKHIKTMLDKGRKKIDLTGDACNLEISIKE